MFDRYYVSKLSFMEDSKRINSLYVYSYKNRVLVEEGNKDREWLISHLKNFDDIFALDKNEYGDWVQRNPFTYEDGCIHWDYLLPQNIIKRKVFVSFYHDDNKYKLLLEKILEDLSINKSVQMGDISSDNADEYIRHLIQSEYLKDTTVLIVLIGPS